QNSYTGIGVTIAQDDDSGLFRVIGVLEDSPARQAGVEIGDLLCAVDGRALDGLASAEVKEIIAEKQGKVFDLTLRAQDGSERTVTVSTATLKTEPVKYELLDSGIGDVKIKNFETGAGEGIISAVDALAEQGARGILFDVRNNPGGLLNELIEALDHILPEGDIFISADKSGNENVKSSDADCVELPMAVLMNENSYSAAEFFAAALSEYGWAELVGAHTTGKARSQINLVLIDGSAVHLSTNSYLTPNRIDLAEAGGLAPDVPAALGEEDAAKLASGALAYEDDAQLQAALRGLKAGAEK
ncbi:MAG: PDZ domain-containing protein, partial [Oscillospiraceae bacterium]|nr:PDZ domain-containing protein [Oscillospiraceae bacterium]